MASCSSFTGDGHRLAGALDAFQTALNVTGDPGEFIEVRPEYLDGKIAARTGEHFRNAHLDRLGEAGLDAREIDQRVAQLTDEPFLVRHAPFLARLELEEGVGFVEPHGIEAEFIRADASDDFGHFGDLGEQCALDLEVAFHAVFERNRGQLGKLNNHRAFVHRRQEGLAGHRIGDTRQQQRDTRHRVDQLPAPECRIQQRVIARGHLAHQPGLVVAFVRLHIEDVERHHRNQREREHERGEQRSPKPVNVGV